MNQSVLYKKEAEVLQGLQQIFDLTGYLTELSSRKENGMTDILRAEHPEVGIHGDEVLGEYYFLPALTDKVDAMNLVISMTLTDSLKKEAVTRIQTAITKINAVLPFGAFVLDVSEEILSYRYVAVCFEQEDADQIVKKASYLIAMALQFTALWIDSLLDLEGGRLSEADFLELFFQYGTGAEQTQ